MNYESVTTRESTSLPGVKFTVVKFSFGRRIELTRRIQELAQKAEFLQAGDKPVEKIGATLVSMEIDRLYLHWGLTGIEGLDLDGQPATPELLDRIGPEVLCKEIVAAIKSECALNEAERKNS